MEELNLELKKTKPSCLINVIIPVYNAEAFLSETIDSVLSQTFTEFELLALDDGSTDSSGEILFPYKDERLRRIRNHALCNECVYQWLCPPPSNYKLTIGRPNLCHILY